MLNLPGGKFLAFTFRFATNRRAIIIETRNITSGIVEPDIRLNMIYNFLTNCNEASNISIKSKNTTNERGTSLPSKASEIGSEFNNRAVIFIAMDH